MARFVDGFVVPVPKKKLSAYKALAKRCGKIWREHGALAYVECVGVGLEPGKHTSFPRSVKLKKDEVVVFAWILYESKRARDRINAACLKDPRLADMADPKKHPFDAKRMFWGGFAAMVEL